MNSPLVTLTVPPRSPRVVAQPAAPRPQKAEPPGDDLRQLAFEIVQHSPLLAQLLIRSGERRRRN